MSSSLQIIQLLQLADENPTLDDLVPYLKDPQPEVRRTALTVLSEAPPSWQEASPLIAQSLNDPDPSVSSTAAGLLKELSEVLVSSPAFNQELLIASKNIDPSIRTRAIEALWRNHLVSSIILEEFLNDSDIQVRKEAVLGLVSVDALEALEKASKDTEPNIRLCVAQGLASVGNPNCIYTLIKLAKDEDFLVRAAAFKAMSVVGCPESALEIAKVAIFDPAWQVRAGVAVALSNGEEHSAISLLITMTGDPNLDVRKETVRSLTKWAGLNKDATEALYAALNDTDADVRAYARLSLGTLIDNKN